MLSGESPDLLRHVLIKRMSLATIDNQTLPNSVGRHSCGDVYDSNDDEWSTDAELRESYDGDNGNFTPRILPPSMQNFFNVSANQTPVSVNDNRRYFSSADPPRNPDPSSRQKPFPCPSSPFPTSHRSRCDIVFGSVIGKGAFGQVYRGLLHGRPVAIKVVQKRRGSGIHREILQAERLAFSMNLRHENIVNVLGVNMCDGVRGDALIVMELVSPKTLQSALDDTMRDISLLDRLRFASEITKALDYLHLNSVVHLDVKPRNVLMTADDRCKLADFGSLTQTCSGAPKEDVEYTQLLGTLAYRAPELMNRCYPSSKADIYSLGVTLWQLATRETPHVGANPHWLIYQVVKANKRPMEHYTGSDLVEMKYKELYMLSWEAEPTARPSATEVLQYLDNLKQMAWQKEWIEKRIMD
ncbi:hypothetical protein Btru_033617 [Bulinus truncatus]|nr:hypothetical protein Btru_033617 [Bulinus truncatus]